MLDNELIEKYPFLEVKNTDYSNTWTNSWLNELEPGWKIAFGEDLCKDLAASIKEDNCENTFEFEQIKEKYGSLRLYATGYGDKTKEVLSKYEELSKYICGRCGKNAKWVSDGWIYPFCDDCIAEVYGNPTSIQKFYRFDTYDNVLKEIEHIKTNYKYDDYWKTIE